MILKDLLERTAKNVLGLRVDVTDERLTTLDFINLAAQEVWKSADINGSMREDVFNILEDYHMISFPYYVEAVRGVRPYPKDGSIVRITALKDKYLDMYPYMAYDTTQTIWRHIGTFPLERDLGSATNLTATLTLAETEPISIMINGSTVHAESVVEELIIPVGSFTATSTKIFTPFPGIKAIYKDVETLSNVVITDNAGNRVAMIANKEKEARNVVMEILDCDQNLTSQCLSYQVLYKLRFTPFISDYDTIPSDEYGNAIYYKVKELYESEQPGKEDRALLAFQKSADIVEKMTKDTFKSNNPSIKYGPRRYHNFYVYDPRHGEICE